MRSVFRKPLTLVWAAVLREEHQGARSEQEGLGTLKHI